MGLDKDDSNPPVNLKKRTTKVNVAMVIGVMLFFIIAGVVVIALFQEPSKSETEAVPLPG